MGWQNINTLYVCTLYICAHASAPSAQPRNARCGTLCGAAPSVMRLTLWCALQARPTSLDAFSAFYAKYVEGQSGDEALLARQQAVLDMYDTLGE
eukprot:16081-Chlamydomonas_euryale.AAC.1